MQQKEFINRVLRLLSARDWDSISLLIGGTGDDGDSRFVHISIYDTVDADCLIEVDRDPKMKHGSSERFTLAAGIAKLEKVLAGATVAKEEKS